MRFDKQEILPVNADDTVAEAVDLAARFVAAKKDEEKHAGNIEEIRRSIAQESRLRPSFIQRLCEPARRPKRVDAHVKNRLLEAYLGYLREKLINIEAEVERVEKMARPDHRAVQALAVRARNLADKVEALL